MYAAQRGTKAAKRKHNVYLIAIRKHVSKIFRGQGRIVPKHFSCSFFMGAVCSLHVDPSSLVHHSVPMFIFQRRFERIFYRYLTSVERAAFAQLLLVSSGDDAADEDAWELEVERRLADVESGLTAVVELAEALVQVRASLRALPIQKAAGR